LVDHRSTALNASVATAVLPTTEGCFVRQRLSSERDRYRGRRRVPTPPRSRYAVVGLSAFVGAGAVALGAAHVLPDAKAVNPKILARLADSSTTKALAERDAGADRASRGENRVAAAKADPDKAAQDVWLLPLDDYAFTSPYGVRWGKLHAGVDLAAPEGTPYKAVHAGVVTAAGYNGGYGYAITIKQADGVEVIYAHSRRLLVKAGDKVTAGQVIGEVGNTGYSYGTHLHLEVHQNGAPTDPIPFLRDRGVDIKLQVESVYAGMAAAAS
jgi:murein DD-endopeptidase MepM/ murein hydrolase activator NlpD